jgi:hypothetical protein
MRTNIFPIFITGLGLFTAYVFYALWHTEAVTPSTLATTTTQTPPPPRRRDTNTLSITHSVKPMRKIDTSVVATHKHKTVDNASQAVALDVNQIEEQTEEVYEALLPDNYDEINEQSRVAFNALDATVMEMNAQVAREEEMLDLER